MEIIDLRTVRSFDQAGPVARGMLAPVLYPASAIYGCLAALHRRLAGSGPSVAVPVISVGSLLVGGTGKTPICMQVAEHLAGLGRRVCIISRGYMRRGGTSPLAVSNGSEVLATVDDAGDEPYLMAKRLPGVAVMVDRDRARAARAARAGFGPDVLVLDDGFQTRSIRKDLEIICIDAASLASKQHLLPLGRLREGWGAIRPEHIVIVVVSRWEARPNSGSFARLAARRVLVATRDVAEVVDRSGAPVDARSLSDRRLLVLSGIARPAGFEDACRSMGLPAVVSLRMNDHHWYNKRDTDRVADLMNRYRCTDVITTEKDFHRLPEAIGRHALVVRDRLEVDNPAALTQALKEAARIT